MLAFLAVMFAIFAYGLRLLWESILLLVVGVGVLIRKPLNMPKLKAPSKTDFKSIGKRMVFVILAGTIAICFLYILGVEGQEKQMLFTLIGSVAAITLFALRRKWKGFFNGEGGKP